MKDKKLIVLLSILVILIVIFIFYQDDNKNDYVKLDNHLLEKNLNFINLYKGNEEVYSLTKVDKKWYLNKEKYIADERKVKSLIESYVNLKRIELVSSEKDNFVSYGLGDDSRYKLIFKTSKKENIFEISSRNTAESYLKYNDRIYQARSNLSKYFKSLSDMRNKRIVQVELKDVQGFQIEEMSKKYVFKSMIEKNDKKEEKTVWKSDELNGEISNTEVESFVTSLTNLVVNDFDEKKSIEEYQKQSLVRKIILNLKNGSNITIEVREKEEDSELRIYTSTRKSIGIIGSYYSQILLQDINKFLK